MKKERYRDLIAKQELSDNKINVVVDMKKVASGGGSGAAKQ